MGISEFDITQILKDLYERGIIKKIEIKSSMLEQTEIKPPLTNNPLHHPKTGADDEKMDAGKLGGGFLND